MSMAAATLVCKQCNFENEPERVYCHNCGAKLDRSLLPPEASRREDPVIVQDRVRKLVSPGSGVSLRQLKNFFFSLLIAAILAGILLLIQPPGNIPDVSKEAVLNALPISDDLEGFVSQGGAPRRLTYKEDQVNAFLQYAIRGKEGSNFGVSLKFERAYVHFLEGRCSITSTQSLFGLPIYATTVRSVEIQNGTLVSRSLGGRFGRLPIPAAIMPYLEGVFNPLWKVLDKDRARVARLQTITFHDKTVEMINKPGAAGQ